MSSIYEAFTYTIGFPHLLTKLSMALERYIEIDIKRIFFALPYSLRLLRYVTLQTLHSASVDTGMKIKRNNCMIRAFLKT